MAISRSNTLLGGSRLFEDYLPSSAEKPDTLSLLYPEFQDIITKAREVGKSEDDITNALSSFEKRAIQSYTPQSVASFLGRTPENMKKIREFTERTKIDSYEKAFEGTMTRSQIRERLDAARYLSLSESLLLNDDKLYEKLAPDIEKAKNAFALMEAKDAPVRDYLKRGAYGVGSGIVRTSGSFARMGQYVFSLANPMGIAQDRLEDELRLTAKATGDRRSLVLANTLRKMSRNDLGNRLARNMGIIGDAAERAAIAISEESLMGRYPTLYDRTSMALGSIAMYFVPGAIAARVAHTGLIGQSIYFGVTKGGLESLSEGGEVYDSLIKQGVKKTDALAAANLVALGQAPINMFTDALGNFVAGSGGVIRGMLGRGTSEFFQESFQGILSDYMSEVGPNKKPHTLGDLIRDIPKLAARFPDAALEEGIPAFIASAILGGGEGVVRLVAKRTEQIQARVDADPEVKAQQAAVEVTGDVSEAASQSAEAPATTDVGVGREANITPETTVDTGTDTGATVDTTTAPVAEVMSPDDVGGVVGESPAQPKKPKQPKAKSINDDTPNATAAREIAENIEREMMGAGRTQEEARTLGTLVASVSLRLSELTGVTSKKLSDIYIKARNYAEWARSFKKQAASAIEQSFIDRAAELDAKDYGIYESIGDDSYALIDQIYNRMLEAKAQSEIDAFMADRDNSVIEQLEIAEGSIDRYLAEYNEANETSLTVDEWLQTDDAKRFEPDLETTMESLGTDRGIDNEVLKKAQRELRDARREFIKDRLGFFEDLLDGAGFNVYIEKSRVSDSHYISVNLQDGESLKIRFSDHPDYHGGNDLNLWFGDSMEENARRIAEFIREKTGVPVDTDMLEQPAFAGSPFDFTRFSTEHIGTGEGAQAFGWGLYFASLKEIADWYRIKLTTGTKDVTWSMGGVDYANPQFDVRARPNVKDAITRIMSGYKDDVVFAFMKKGEVGAKDEVRSIIADEIKSNKDFIAELEGAREGAADFDEVMFNQERQIAEAKIAELERISQYVDSMRFDTDATSAGQLYRVEIPDSDVLLDHDKRMSEQPDNVLNALKKAAANKSGDDLSKGMANVIADAIANDYTGATLYSTMSKYVRSRGDGVTRNAGDKVASLFLNDLGIPGLQYLDAASRSQGEGSHNFVIFDDSAIEIMEKYFEEQKKNPRANINLYPGMYNSIINLFETADKSSSFHEYGHHLFNILAGIRNEATGMDQSFAAMIDNAFQEMGITVEEYIAGQDKDKSNAAQEQFARTWEAYLANGQAPTSTLQTVFNKIRTWLVEVYQDIQKALGVNVSDNMRKFFDTLVASPEQRAMDAAESTVAAALDPDIDALTSNETRFFEPDMPTPSSAQPGRPVTIGDIRDRIAKLLPWRYGNMAKGLLGVFKVMPEVARTRLRNDIPAIMHEMGHYLDKVLGLSTTPNAALQKELIDAGSQTSTLQYSRVKVLREGVAQFFLHYAINKDQAKSLFPEYYKEFNARLDQNPELKKTVTDITDRVSAYYKQSPEDRLFANIISAADRKPTDLRQFAKQAWNKAYEMAVDSMAPLQRATEELKSKMPESELVNGKYLPDNMNLYGRVMTAAGFRGKADVDVNSFMGVLNGLKKGDYKIMSNYLAAMRAQDYRNNGLLPGLGVDSGEELSIISKTPDRVKNAAAQLMKIYHETVKKTLVETGVMSQKQYDYLRKKWPNYVKFIRVENLSDFNGDVASFFGGRGRKLIDIPSPIKRARGVQAEAEIFPIRNPLEAMVADITTFHSIASRNEIGKTLLNISKVEGMGRFAERVQGPGERGESVFHVWNRGVKEYYATDSDIYFALSAVNDNLRVPKELKTAAKPFTFMANFFKMGTTRYNPAFILRNFMRDAANVVILSDSWTLPMVSTIHGLFIQWSNNPKMKAIMQEAVDSGLFYSGVTEIRSHSPRAVANQIQAAIKEGGVTNKTRQMIYGLGNIIGSWNEAIELAPKIHEFLYLREHGVPKVEAAMHGRRINLDFSRAGYAGRVANRATPFLNAKIQGIDKAITTLAQHPGRTMSRVLLWGVLPSVITWALSNIRGDDDEKKEYSEINRSIKDNFWCLKMGDLWVRLPKPDVFGLFGSLVERGLDYAYNRDQAATRGLVETVIDEFKPPILPTLILPFYEAWANRDTYTGNPIVPDRYKDLPPEMQYGPYTSGFARAIGDLATISPMMIDHLIRGYSGTMGSLIVSTLNPALNTEQREATKLTEGVLARSIFLNPYKGSESMDRFYELFERTNHDFVRYQNKRGEGGINKNVRFAGMFSDAAKRISGMRKSRAVIQMNQNMSPEDRRYRMDVLDGLMIDVARKALEAYDNY